MLPCVKVRKPPFTWLERLFQNLAGPDAMPPHGRPRYSEVRRHLFIGHPEEKDVTQYLELPVAKDLARHANSLRDPNFHTAAATVTRRQALENLPCIVGSSPFLVGSRSRG